MRNERARLITKLDKVFSEYIRARDFNVCFTCGKSKHQAVIQCGHLITRARHATRWSEENAHAQCAGCNFKHEHSPEVFTLKYIHAHGKKAYEKLVEKSWSKTKFTIQDLRDILEYYKIKLEEIDNEKN
jgi:hypothetical protein